MPISGMEISFSSRGFFSKGKAAWPLERTWEFRLLPKEAASSAAKDDRIEDRTCADDDDAASFAATAAAAFL